MARKKKSSPEWVDKLINFREEIGEEDYARYWRNLNRVRKDRDAWDKKGREIIREIKGNLLVFKSTDFRNIREARRAAEIARADNGGRIVRRNAKGRFSKRGHTFQVIGG